MLDNNTVIVRDLVIDNVIPWYVIMYVIIYSCCSIIGTFGNIMVIVVTLASKILRNSRNAFILSLSSADLMVSSVTMPASIVGVLVGQKWSEDKSGLCAFTSIMCAPGCVASMHSIAWIAISRYFYIGKYPTYVKYFTPGKIWIYIGSIWMLGFVVHSPNYFGWGRMRYSTIFRFCTLDTDLYSYALFYASVLVAAIILSFIFYFKIYLVLRGSKLSKTMIMSKGLGKIAPSEKAASLKPPSSMTVEIKIIKTSFKIFILFLITWMPVCILFLIPRHIVIPAFVHLYAALLAHCNSTLNFLVYFFENDTFRNAAKSLIRKTLNRQADQSMFTVTMNRSHGRNASQTIPDA